MTCEDVRQLTNDLQPAQFISSPWWKQDWMEIIPDRRLTQETPNTNRDSDQVVVTVTRLYLKQYTVRAISDTADQDGPFVPILRHCSGRVPARSRFPSHDPGDCYR